MRVWIINPFDPLPGEPERAGRFAHLAYALSDAGHSVVWWTAEFSHRFKRTVDTGRVRQAGQARGVEIQCISVPSYTRNVSLRRLWSHRAFGHSVGRAMTQSEPPDVITASAPPLESAEEATRFGADHQIPTVVDILDQWPDTFTRALPRIAQPLRKVGFYPYYRAERSAYERATGIIGVAQGYLNRGLEVGGPKEHTAVLHLGVDLGEFDEAMRKAQARAGRRWIKPKNETWVLYGGSLSHSYDFETIFHAARRAREHYGQRVRFIIAGDGDLGPRARTLHEELALDTVSMPGFLPLAEWAELLSQADIGLIATFPQALIYMPYKVHDYLAAGVAILNTLPGECAALVSDNRCGLNYRAGDPDDLFTAIRHVVDHPEERRAMGLAARRLAETTFDRRIISEKYVRFLETVAARR
jgi:glycosyltransferase involved in cell wall biosynthesis